MPFVQLIEIAEALEQKLFRSSSTVSVYSSYKRSVFDEFNEQGLLDGLDDELSGSCRLIQDIKQRCYQLQKQAFNDSDKAIQIQTMPA